MAVQTWQQYQALVKDKAWQKVSGTFWSDTKSRPFSQYQTAGILIFLQYTFEIEESCKGENDILKYSEKNV